MNRLKTEFSNLLLDIRTVAGTLGQNHSVQLVILLAILPWLITAGIHRDIRLLAGLGPIVGLILIYWLFTRGWPVVFLPVRRRRVESGIAVLLAAVWMAWRVAEYMRLVVLPPLHIGLCDDIIDTIIPKMIEMVFMPLLIFILLRYSLRQLGLGWSSRTWLPALVPIVIYLVFGFAHQKPADLFSRILCFYLGAGLPEEFVFRGLVQSRLEALVRRPEWGILLAGVVFGATHLPIDIHGAGVQNWQGAVETAFTYQMGVGLALGYAFYRARNLWPLTVIHALIDSVPLPLAACFP